MNEWDIEAPVYVLEGDASRLFENANQLQEYVQLPIFPSIQRDVSVLVDLSVKIAEVEKLIRKKGSQYLKEIRFYDLYKGKNIDKGQKSITFNLVFQAEERTLQDIEIDDTMAAIHKILQKELGAQLR